MDLLEAVNEARQRQHVLRSKRQALHEQLHTHLAVNDAVYAKEREIRAEIKAVQGELYPIDQALSKLAEPTNVLPADPSPAP